MTTRSPSDFDFDRTIDAWLAIGPTELSDRVVETTRAQLHRSRRASTWRTPWVLRRQFSGRFVARLGAAVVIVAVLGLGIRLATVSPTGTTPSPSPTHFASRVPPAGAFQATGAMSTGRLSHTATLLQDGRVLVAGGSNWVADAGPDGYLDNPLVSSAELYDPVTGVFTPTGSMTTPRAHQTATLLADGRVLIVGGGNSGTEADHGAPLAQGFALASAEIYDPATGLFTPTGSMGEGRVGGAAVRLADGRVLVLAGTTSNDATGTASPITAAEIYDPATGTFSPNGSITGFTFGSPILLADGRVLGLAFTDPSGPTSIATYDPASGAFGIGTSLPSNLGSSTRLADGKVLIVGEDSQGMPFSAANLVGALYDPATGSLHSTVTSGIDFQPFTETLLGDGRVLLIGFSGRGDGARPPFAVLYDPVAETFSVSATPVYSGTAQTSTLLLDGRVLTTGGGSNGARTPSLTTAELFR